MGLLGHHVWLKKKKKKTVIFKGRNVLGFNLFSSMFDVFFQILFSVKSCFYHVTNL